MDSNLREKMIYEIIRVIRTLDWGKISWKKKAKIITAALLDRFEIKESNDANK